MIVSFRGILLRCLIAVLSVYASYLFYFFFFKQKTAYEMRISDWSSDVCSSDLHAKGHARRRGLLAVASAELHLDLAGGVVHEHRQRTRDPGELEEIVEIGRASCRERVCQYV